MQKQHAMLAATRIALGFVFLWAFLDKALGLGFSTCRVSGEYLGPLCERAWLMGGSPTTGFLSGVQGPFAWLFNPLAGHPVVNTLFMLGLLGIGVALILGICMRIASYAGALLLFLMWLAVLPISTHPFLDDHIVYGMVLVLLLWLDAGDYYGLGTWWKNTELIQKYPWLA